MSEERRFSLTSGNLAGLEWNAGCGGIPTLALHGWLDNARSFEPLALRQSRQLLSIDLPGHGLSDHRPRGCNYHMVDVVADIAELVESLQWERFRLLGHSMGAGIATMLAAALGDQISELVLIDGIGPLSAPPQHSTDRLMKHLKQRSLLDKKTTPRYDSIDDAVRARQGVAKIDSSACRLLVERNLVVVDRGYTWCTDPRLRITSSNPFLEEQVRDYISRISAPTLLIRAVPGLAIVLDGLASRLDCVPNLDYKELPGNHHIHMEQPEAVVAAIEGFHERTQSRAG